MRFSAVILVAAALPVAAAAQGARADSGRAPGACWRFAFGEWTPALDWARAGHAGDASQAARTVQRVRDSVYDKDTVATHANAMTIQYTKQGMLVMLYPPWWPAGVELTFDSTMAGGREMSGTAIALIADGRQQSPRAPARAQQVACGGRRPDDGY